MATEIRLPELAPSMNEGALARWIRREGEAIKAGEVIAEIETDKALVELEAPGDGMLGRILVPEGTQGVAVGTLIAWLVQPGEAVPDGALAVPQAPEAKTGPRGLEPQLAAASASSPVPAARTGGRRFASPLARRLARQTGLALEGLDGSGPRGRIVRADVEAALATRPASAAVAAAAPRENMREAAANGHDEVPHSSMRRVIAQRLTEAKQQIPHFYLSIDCQLDGLLALRADANAMGGGIKLSVNDFIVRAVAVAMRQVPAVNASWTEAALRRHRDVDIAVAVATPAGLITPVVRAADQKSVSAISAEVRELAGRAREGRLRPGEYQGGGFTISNLGMHGIREFAAIINPPQACILAVGAGEQRPVVRDGELAAATVMTVTLSADHRVVDGAVGAEFLAAFRKLVEHPLGMLV